MIIQVKYRRIAIHIKQKVFYLGKAVRRASEREKENSACSVGLGEINNKYSIYQTIIITSETHLLCIVGECVRLCTTDLWFTLCVRCLCLFLCTYIYDLWMVFLSSLCIRNVISYDIFVFLYSHTGFSELRYLAFTLYPVLLHLFWCDWSCFFVTFILRLFFRLSRVFFRKIGTTFTMQCKKWLEVQNLEWLCSK